MVVFFDKSIRANAHSTLFYDKRCVLRYIPFVFIKNIANINTSIGLILIPLCIIKSILSNRHQTIWQ